jgi:hypothetical protein
MSLALTLPCPGPICRPARSISIHPPSLARPQLRHSEAYLVDVDFEAPDGESYYAVGGGKTLEDAIASAREALPPGLEWEVVRWNHIYSD